MIWEKWVRISGKPSRYHKGDDRYIGGEIMKRIVGLEAQAASKASRTSWSTGSTRGATEPDPSALAMKLVRHEMRQMEDSARTWPNEGTKFSKFPQKMTWQAFRKGLPRQEFLLMFRRTLESPIREKTCDMMKRQILMHAVALLQSLFKWLPERVSRILSCYWMLFPVPWAVFVCVAWVYANHAVDTWHKYVNFVSDTVKAWPAETI